MEQLGTFTLWAWFTFAAPVGGREGHSKRVRVVRKHYVTRDEAKRITDEYRRINPDAAVDSLQGEWVYTDSF